MVTRTGRKIAHFQAGGGALPTGFAQGLPAATSSLGYTPGPETNQGGSWGRAAETGGVAGDPYNGSIGAPFGAPSTTVPDAGYTTPQKLPSPATAPPAAPAATGADIGAPMLTGIDQSTGLASLGGSSSNEGGGSPGQTIGIPAMLTAAKGGAVPEQFTSSSNPHNSWGGGLDSLGNGGENNNTLSTAQNISSATPVSAAKGGAINPIEKSYREKWRVKNHKHGTPYKAFDQGGSTGDDVPTNSPSGAIPDTPDMPVDPYQGQEGQAGDQLYSKVKQVLSQTRQQFGLTDAAFEHMNKYMQFNPNQQQAGNMPTKPAGPGGDQTQGGPQDRSNQQISGNIPTKPAGPGGDQTQGGPQDRSNPPPVAQNNNDGDEVSAARGGPIPRRGAMVTPTVSNNSNAPQGSVSGNQIPEAQNGLIAESDAAGYSPSQLKGLQVVPDENVGMKGSQMVADYGNVSYARGGAI